MDDTLQLVRGVRATIAIANLVDANGAPANFSGTDVVRFAARYPGDPTPFLTKTSTDGGVTITVGGSTATVNIHPADWMNLALRHDLPFVWDLILLVGGDPTQAVNLDDGTGVVEADVTLNPLSDPVPSGDSYGPCQPWVPLAEATADPRAVRADGSPLPHVLLQGKIEVASAILYRATALQFPGVCTRTVRPTRRWYRADYQPPWWWQWQRAWGTFTSRPPHRDQGNHPSREVSLGAYPVRRIIEVRVDGHIVDPTQYQINDHRWLCRISPDGTGWPAVPDLDGNPLTDLGTFQVIYEWGRNPPRGGVDACKRYAIELAKAAVGDTCQLPERVLNIQQPGASMVLLDPLTFLDKGLTGVYEVDIWIRSVNPHGLRRKSAVLSPDIPRPVRETATTPGS